MTETAEPRPKHTVLVPRHALATRVTHWINVVAFILMLFSGLAIFNAHPALYWGQKTDFDHPWLSMTATPAANGKLSGHLNLGKAQISTTGLLGASAGADGKTEARGFPRWLTLPGYKSLADGRRWHFFFAWLLVLNGLAYVIFGVLNKHLRRDLSVTRDDIKSIPHEIVTHAQLKFPKGEEARHYNVLQKLAYLSIVFVAFPILILAGLTLSPQLDATFHLPDIFFGRQSARSIHFIAAWAIVLFLFVHLFMVVASGTWNNIRSMITGKYAIEEDGDAH
ncbi:MAG TPA: cytochrome b/b6 domain-containing protein [Caulobacteraceae bacterium]|jgi:thiosulfate reductase cytochrome b subunit|nr:cytochrome b/b6 domain-containing protein [Caulobacteraceae bacterium]